MTALDLLTAQRTRLERVIAEDAFVCTTNRARRLLARVNWWLKQPPAAMDLALGDMGPNKDGAEIDDVCREAEFHKLSQGTPLRPTSPTGEAGATNLPTQHHSGSVHREIAA